MYSYRDPLFSSLPPSKELVNTTSRMLSNQQEFARSFGTTVEGMDRTLREGFSGVNSHIDSMGNHISGQIIESANRLADTMVKVGEGINETTFKVGDVLSSQMADNTAHLQGSIEAVGQHLGETTIRAGNVLGQQMFDNTQHLSSVFTEVGAQLSQTIFQSTAAMTGSMFIASLNTNRVLSRAIKRQTRELKNELLEFRSEQMHSRRAITAAQLLAYHELAELKVQTLRNHTETVWMLMRQSSIMQDILETLKHPLRTKALELAETGVYLMSRGLFEQAREALIEGKNTVHDREPSIAVSLAFVYDNLGQGQEVEERLQHAATLAEDRTFIAYVHGLLSDFYWQIGDKEKSFAESSKALSSDPFSPVVRINHAAMLAESGRLSESRALLEGLIRDDTDHAKSILDRQSFYRHDLVADVLKFVQHHLDPVAEAVKNENADFQDRLHYIRENGHYRQFAGHKKRFDETLETLSGLKARRERSPVTLAWHHDVNSAYKRLTEIEEDAARASAATKRFTRLNSARGEVSTFLDYINSRAKAITLDAASHPVLNMECEKIKVQLAEITSSDALHAACDFAINFLNLQIRSAEAAYAEAAQAGFMTRGNKRTAAARMIAAALTKLRVDIEKLHFENISKPFQICPLCFSRWPREYKCCGHCGCKMEKPLKLDQTFNA